MKKSFIYLSCIVILAFLGVGLLTDEGKDKKDDRTKDYLTDPEKYMDELHEKYDNKEKEHLHTHEHEGHHPENLEKLKKKLLEMNSIIVTADDFISVMILIDQEPNEYVNKEIELSGFIYREPEFSNTQVVIGRYKEYEEHHEEIYGLLSTTPIAESLDDGQWVKVKGTLQTTTFIASEVPYLVINEVRLIEAP